MTEQQTTAEVLMIRPASFCANIQTAASNSFQQPATLNHDPQAAALAEFEAMAHALREANVRVHIFDDTAEPNTPDALFPNNWVSFHADGSIVLYPMLAPNRRLERRFDILESLTKHKNFAARRTIDLSHRENAAEFLEGTGSMVLDRVNRIAYACMSPRTHSNVLSEFSRLLNYRLITFDANDMSGAPIYHTNVLMSVGRRFAVVCTDAIPANQRGVVLDSLRSTAHQLIELSHAQMNNFAGNLIELATTDGAHVVALSERASRSLTSEQRALLQSCSGSLVTAAIPTIETLGGGSVRCMLAEIHLPQAAHA